MTLSGTLDPDDDRDRHLIHTTEKGVELWLGSQPNTYYGLGFNLIINLNGSFPVKTRPDFEWRSLDTDCPVLCLPFYDDGYEEYLPKRAKFDAFLVGLHSMIETLEPSNKVLFHCSAGINRSSFVLGLYLARYEKMDPVQIITLIREKRHRLCLTNKLFEAKLKEWA